MPEIRPTLPAFLEPLAVALGVGVVVFAVAGIGLWLLSGRLRSRGYTIDLGLVSGGAAALGAALLAGIVAVVLVLQLR